MKNQIDQNMLMMEQKLKNQRGGFPLIDQNISDISLKSEQQKQGSLSKDEKTTNTEKEIKEHEKDSSNIPTKK